MAESFLIMLREGFEAALIVAIVFAYLRAIGRRDLAPAVWGGVALGGVIAIAIGLTVHWTVGELGGERRLIAFGAISAAAAIVLTWMIFWMRRQSIAIKGELQHKVDAAVHSGRAGTGVLLVAFIAVLREGIEAALFLIAASISTHADSIVTGGVLGLLGAALLGVLVYSGGRRIPLKWFFQITGGLLILFAAGLCSKAVLFFQAAGRLGFLTGDAYDLTRLHWLTVDSEFGRFLAGVLGWDPRPSWLQTLAWWLYLVPVAYLFYAGGRAATKPAPAPATPRPSGVGAGGGA